MYSWQGTSTDFRSNTTSFTRSATAGTQITVSAPATLSGGRIFQYWLKDGSIREYNTSVTMTMDGQHVVDAIYGTSPPTVRTLQSIAIVGPSSVDERTAASYSARATYTDGTTGTVSASWSDNSSYASISSNGLLDAAAVSSDKSVTLTASATVSGVTKSATKTVTIRNTDAAPTYTLDLYAENGRITASPDLRSYEAGTEVRLTAYPDDNYMRSHWSGDASGTERTVYVTINGNKSVTAHFVLDTRTADVTVQIEPAGARADGAGFKISGEGSYLNEWQPSGDTIPNRKAGIQRVWFKTIPGWITPEDISLEVAGGLPVSTTGTYQEVPGAVQVVIAPEDAISAGA
ncbi:MAG: hypothetical protein KDN05_24470, partial [Verrucomicrobiae bacterium]|nr:hypothetical protein [Verrucomicrobiae bacterium]